MLGIGLSNFIANYELTPDDSITGTCCAARPAADAPLELVGQA